jgi:hypothetical protein
MFSMLFLLAVARAARGDAVDDELVAILRAGPQGAGSAEARTACECLSARDAAVLPRLLVAMETPNPVAANWARTAYEAIVARELAAPSPRFPLDELQTFVRERSHAGRVRRLALALCDRLDAGFGKKLIPELLDDPEFREDAVDAALTAGEQALEGGDSETACDKFEQAFEHARRSDQVVRAAGKLTALGRQVDIAAHLGLVIDWWLIGPFDAPGFSGFDRPFPPEERVDLQAEYAGQEGRTLRWVRHRAGDPLGLVDLVQALAPAKEAVGYAYAELEAPREMAAELRCGADDNLSVWLNGEKVFGRNQWLNGIRLDRFVTPVKLRQGTNRVLVKVCQGPQHKDPAVGNAWSMQLRFSDEGGSGLGLRSMLPAAKEPR